MSRLLSQLMRRVARKSQPGPVQQPASAEPIEPPAAVLAKAARGE